MLISMLFAAVVVSSVARACELMPPGRYEITTETGMPHLEENLRYATVRETRCVTRQELATAFPVLAHPSLKGCQLAAESRDGEVISYRLSCKRGFSTSGDAVWQLARKRVSGTLRVELGGKNMTFYQRVSAIRLSDCDITSQAGAERR